MEEMNNTMRFFHAITNQSAIVWGYLEDAEAECVSKQTKFSIRYQCQRNKMIQQAAFSSQGLLKFRLKDALCFPSVSYKIVHY